MPTRESATCQGDFEGALERYDAAIRIGLRLADEDPSNAGWRHGLAEQFDRIGDARRGLGDHSAALEAYKRALEIMGELAPKDPSNAEWQRDLAVAAGKVGAYWNAPQSIHERRVALKLGLSTVESMERRGILRPVDASLPARFRKALAELPSTP
jgi:tetratricopeptide (TPR) repeat protein